MVVVTGLGESDVQLHDPERGPRLVMSLEQFESAWNAMRKGMVTIWR
jgi:predicted double-glycine peptidase